MKKLIAALIGLLFSTTIAAAQSPCSYIAYGAVLTAAQWNSCFSAKQNTLGYTPVNKAGDTMFGKLNTFASAAGSAGFSLLPGSAPTSPVNGDIWITSSGLFARINGSTVGPFIAAGSSPVTSVFSRTGAVVAATNDYSFAQISGSVAASQLPNPSASTLGGVKSLASISHQFLTQIGTDGTPTQAQPAFTDISGSVAASQLPNPAASTLGGVKSLAAVTHNFLTQIGTDGTPAQARPACSDLSDSAAGCSAAVTTVGTAAVGQIPGTITNDDACSTCVGAYLSASKTTSLISLGSGTPVTIISIPLTAGDWDVEGVIYANPAGTTVLGSVVSAINTTDNTLPATWPYAGGSQWGGPASAGQSVIQLSGTQRITVSSTATAYLIADVTFSVSTVTGGGTIRARRVR